ncbi:hypothetical protein A3770_18p82630 [Chloropicon primus]|uniref:E3 ubiquitin-protein ligase n=2 Tax=Chloropicon primus TaxID=1764295 RepID=A0A5B8N1J0_9CHLO|nr:hypothetical protein A3770_18p82630 [Chloropicon primus]|eukprot:QDZ25745.1 hypothetical protein A3770_18p82630 [Chloropicon primus]
MKRALNLLEKISCKGEIRGLTCAPCTGPCTTIWNAGALAYRCRTCQVNDSSAICPECFAAGDHEGHDYSLYVSDHGGCCDCGDELSWRKEGFCKRHGGACGSMDVDAQGVSSFSPEMKESIQTMFNVVAKKLVHIVLHNVAECAGAKASPLHARLNFEGEEVAKELLLWISTKTEDFAESRELMCHSFLLEASSEMAAGEPGNGARGILEELDAQATARLRRLFAENAVLERDVMTACVDPTTADDMVEDGNNAKASNVVFWLLMTLKYLPSSLVDALTTCILRLTYNEDFKYEFTKLMILGYHVVCDVETMNLVHDPHNLDRSMHRNFLTRLTVQLFNCPIMTLELVQMNNLLDTVFQFLDNLLWRCCTGMPEDGGRVNIRSRYIVDKMYSRTLGDIQMILEHRTSVVPHLLENRIDLFHKMLEAFEKLQGMNEYRRKRGDHVERENTDWINCVMLESEMFLNMFEQLFSGMAQGITGSSRGGRAIRENIWAMGGQAIAFTKEWVAKDSTRRMARADASADIDYESDTIFERLFKGEDVSINLPMHRVCARMLQYFANKVALEDGDQGRTGKELGEAKMNKLLEFVQAHREDILSVIEPILKAQAFMMQVRLGLWVRNGEEVLKLQRTYNTAMWFWHEISWELDSFLLKVWVGAAKDSSEALRTLVDCFGGKFLMNIKSLQDVGTSETERIPLVSELLQELVKILLDRSCVYSPKESVRRGLIHWLFVNERQTHSKLMHLLSLSHRNYKGIDDILNEIADYHEPKLEEHGQYKLKAECWKEFDIFFPLYSKADLQKALENAEQSNSWNPDMQFKGVDLLEGDPLQFVFRVLDNGLFYQLIWSALLVSLKKPSGYAEGAVNTVLHLIYHAMDQTERGGTTGGTGGVPFAAGFASNDLKASLAFRPGRGGGEPSILEMLHHVADIRYSYDDERSRNASASDGRGFSLQPFGASENLKTCVKHVLEQLKSKGFVVVTRSGEEEKDTTAKGDLLLKKKREDRQAAVMAAFMAQQQAFLDTITDSESDEEMENVQRQEEEEAQAKEEEEMEKEEQANCECALCKGEIKDVHSLCWVGHAEVSSFPSRALKEEEQREAAALDASASCVFDSTYGIHVKTCGHKMHFECYRNYIENLLERSRSGLRYEGMSILSVGDQEFLCPVCRRFSNTVVPCCPRVPNPSAIARVTQSLQHFLTGCCDKFQTFASKANNNKEESSSSSSSWMMMKKPNLLYSNLVEIIGYNVAHFEVLLRKTKTSNGYNWVDVEAARCAGKGQLLVLKELTCIAQMLTKCFNQQHLNVDRMATFRKVNKIRRLLLMGEAAHDGGSEGEGDYDRMNSGPALPFVRSFLMENSPPDVISSHRDYFEGLNSTRSVLEDDPIREIVKYNHPNYKAEDIRSVCDPFKLFMELHYFCDDAGGAVDLALRLSVYQAACSFVLSTYCNAVSEHLSLMEGEEGKGAAEVDQAEVDQAEVDAMYNELQATLGRILDQEYGGALLDRMLGFVESSVAPFLRRSYVFSNCLRQKCGFDFENLVRNGLPETLTLGGKTILGHMKEAARVWGAPGGWARLRAMCPNVLPQILDAWSSKAPSLGSVFGSSLNYSLVAESRRRLFRPSLIQLPHLYQNALVEWLDRKCLRCNKVPKEPALCLVCGQLVCCAETCCKDARGRGECTQHSLVCGARTGVFLLLRQTAILILSGSHTCIYSSPYLDAHGEEDPALKRGKPLSLDKNRYEALNLMWATGGFDYDSKVLRRSVLRRGGGRGGGVGGGEF